MDAADALREARRALARNTLDKRLAQGRTIEDVAIAAGMEPRHLAAIETGGANPQLSTIASVSASLGVDVRDLFAPLAR